MRIEEMKFLTLGVMVAAFFCLGESVFAAGPVSAEATRYFTRGLAAAEMARSTADYAEAAMELEKARQLAPQWPEVYYNLGLLHEKAGNYDGAIEAFRVYLQLTPSSPDGAKIQKTIYKLEYMRERNNLNGIWKTDVNESNVSCTPPGYLVGKGLMLSSVFVIHDLQMEFRKEPDGERVRVLSGKHRYGRWLPDGPFTTVRREGESVVIYGAVMNACSDAVQYDHCPWKGKFLLKHVSSDVLEGTVDVTGAAHRIINYRTSEQQFEAYQCTGKIVLRRISRQ